MSGFGLILAFIVAIVVMILAISKLKIPSVSLHHGGLLNPWAHRGYPSDQPHG